MERALEDRRKRLEMPAVSCAVRQEKSGHPKKDARISMAPREGGIRALVSIGSNPLMGPFFCPNG